MNHCHSPTGAVGIKLMHSKHYFRLAGSPGEGENESVRARARITVLLMTILVAWMMSGFPSGWSQATSPHVPPAEMRVDINHASVEELMKVPGMTRSWAGRIVRFRPYRTKQDLVEHGVVSSDVYQRIKGYIIAHRS
jgi:DNA uptake protein ComE-like DNA-binding protein